MKGAPLTVTEACVILRADEALDLTYEVRLAAGTTFNDKEREAWTALVQSAHDRIAGWKCAVAVPVTPDRYPGGNEPGFQTLALEAVAAAARLPSSSYTEAQELRTGIETIVRTFGTSSAEWVQQFRALLDRVPAARRTA